MKRTLIISILILNAVTLAAIRPNRVYSYTPDKLDLTYEEFKIKTDDGIAKGKQVVKTFDCEYLA